MKWLYESISHDKSCYAWTSHAKRCIDNLQCMVIDGSHIQTISREYLDSIFAMASVDQQIRHSEARAKSIVMPSESVIFCSGNASYGVGLPKWSHCAAFLSEGDSVSLCVAKVCIDKRTSISEFGVESSYGRAQSCVSFRYRKLDEGGLESESNMRVQLPKPDRVPSNADSRMAGEIAESAGTAGKYIAELWLSAISSRQVTVSESKVTKRAKQYAKSAGVQSCRVYSPVIQCGSPSRIQYHRERGSGLKKRLHFVRAHFRILQDPDKPPVLVRQHWRGDAGRGVVAKTYKVKSGGHR